MRKKGVSIGIIGGTGRMGRWFEKFFTNAGHRVFISGRSTDLTSKDLAARCEVVILSIPLAAALDAAGNVGPMLSESQLLMDVCSLKEEIAARMTASTRAQVIGAHPLFGPGTATLAGQNVILCPMRGESWLAWLRTELEEGGAVVTLSDPRTHDRYMAVVQGLNHFITIATGRALQRMGLSPEDLSPFSTPVFRLKLEFIGRLFSQPPELFADLIGANPHFAEALEKFRVALQEVEKSFSAKSGESLGLMAEIHDFLGGFCESGTKEIETFLSKSSGVAPHRSGS
jgi:prephenate dehydrogenase